MRPRSFAIAIALALFPPTAVAHTGSLDLSDAATVRLASHQGSGGDNRANAGLGDFNGDGRNDLALTGLFSDTTYSISLAHDVFVDFGAPGARSETLPTTAGLVIRSSASEMAGEVADAGDVNGDGLGDVVLGGIGSAWVVFGAPQPGTIDLASLGARGFAITGEPDEWLFSVDGTGDVNTDGLADVVVGSRTADPHGRSNAGAAYVVYGKQTTDEVQTAALGEAGFEIAGAAPSDSVGLFVRGAGDVNGDGRGDVLLGHTPVVDPHDIHVVFTPADQGDVDLAQAHAGLRVGPVSVPAISAAGDVNSDGFADVAVGDIQVGTSATTSGRGAAYVVYGRASSGRVDLESLGNEGLDLRPSAGIRSLGAEVAAVGDVNGDGFSDIAVGGAADDDDAQTYWSATWIVFGRGGGGNVELSDLGASGFRILSRAPDNASAGGSAFEVGDRNGDARDDIGIGELSTCDIEHGTVYIVPSPASPSGLPADPYVDRAAETWIGTSVGDPRVGTPFADILRGEAGDDCLDGADGSDDISGGEGDDGLTGGLGADVVAGDAGSDRLVGTWSVFYDDYVGQADVLLGGPGDDVLGSEEFNQKGKFSLGEAGDDRFDGGDGDDRIDAGVGDDIATGGPGDDGVSGDSGRDRLAGDAGADSLGGDAGNDLISGGPDGDVLAGRGGNDLLGGDTGRDLLGGGGGSDVLAGDLGNDYMRGGSGGDTLDGGRGRDRLAGGRGLDELFGRRGKDFVNSADGVAEVVRCGRGRDTVEADQLDQLIGCEQKRFRVILR